MPPSDSDKQTLPVQPPPKPKIKKTQTNPSPRAPPPSEQDRYYALRLQNSSVSLADAIASQRSISSFSSLSRLRAPTANLLSDLAARTTTVLAPLNAAIDDHRDRAGRNVERFVEAHLVTTASPWEEGMKAQTLAGREIWWEQRDGKRVVLPDGIEVDRVAGRVANGELWFVKGVLKYE